MERGKGYSKVVTSKTKDFKCTFTFSSEQRIVFCINKKTSTRTKVQRRGAFPFPSLAPINMMETNLQHFELAENYINEEASQNDTNNDQDTVSNKCNQCKYASSQAGNLKRHLKAHSGKKSK